MYIVPTYNSIIVAEKPMNETEVYMQHEMEKERLFGNKRVQLARYFVTPQNTPEEIEKALSGLKLSPGQYGIKIIGNVDQTFVTQIGLIARGNHQEYNQTISSMNRSYD